MANPYPNVSVALDMNAKASGWFLLVHYIHEFVRSALQECHSLAGDNRYDTQA